MSESQSPGTPSDLARQAAEFAADNLFHVHRGTFRWCGYAAIFGNDGYARDERSRLQVDILRQYLDEAGIEEVAFGLDERTVDPDDGTPIEADDRGYTWAMLVRPRNAGAPLPDLHELVWRACEAAGNGATDPEFQSYRRAQESKTAS
jgi:hypothetical protein